MYLQSGRIKLSVVNEVGKEAVVAMLAPGDFFGEGCLAGQSVRMGTATAITPSAVLDIEKTEMFKVLHEQHAFSDRFLTSMLTIDTNGRPIVNPFLWSLEFRTGGTNVDLNALYFHGPPQQSAGWIVWRNSDHA
jgi:hypothetical protein